MQNATTWRGNHRALMENLMAGATISAFLKQQYSPAQPLKLAQGQPGRAHGAGGVYVKTRATCVRNSLVRRRILPTLDSTAQRERKAQRRIDDKADTRIGAVCSIGDFGEKSGQTDLVRREQGEAGSRKGGIGVSMGGTKQFMAGDEVLGALCEAVVPA